MVVAEKINHYVQRLPERLQAEVLDFVEFLLLKADRDNNVQEDVEWTKVSLAFAMRGMEDEDGPEYGMSDLKESFK